MPIQPIRVKQTTNTTGTGSLTLNAAATEYRSFNTAFGGGSQVVRYIIKAGTSAWEEGYGTFNGGSPGTLTRTTVVASSNGGSLISLPAGVADVYFDFLIGDRTVRVVSANTTLDLSDIGNLIRCTQTGDITLTLPPVATVPVGMGFLIKNDGTNWSLVLIDPNAAEALEAVSVPFPLFGNECIEIFSTGSGWRTGPRPTGERMVARAAASGSSSIDFILPPAYPSVALSAYRVAFRNVRPGTDGAVLWMRTDADGGASYDAGASDYVWSRAFVSGAAAGTFEAPAAGAQIPLTTDLDVTDTSNTAMGSVSISPGNAGARRPHVMFDSSGGGNGGSFAGLQRLVGGAMRATAQDINAVRFLMSTGNISQGEFVLFATYP